MRNGQAKSIISLSKTGNNYTEGYKGFNTIEKLFGFIEREKKAVKLNVQYDETLGYPKDVFVDQHGWSDDKLSLKITSLEVGN